MTTSPLLPLLLALLLASSAAAQGDDPFGDDSLFGGDGPIVEEVEDDPDADPADALLTGDALAIGGRFALAAEAVLSPGDDEAFSVGLVRLGTSLFLDARPSGDLRVFVEADLAYGTQLGVRFELDEMFADFDVADTVFVRAGKQTVNWGVGYFFSPANLVNLERIDPDDPEAPLSGPVSVKAQVPIGTDNVTAYLILDDIGAGTAASVAARYELLVEGFEVTTGAILESDGHWAVMATGTGAVGNATVFAEAVLEGGSDKRFVVRDPSSPTGWDARTSDDLFGSATLGVRYSHTTPDDRFTVSLVAQYLVNGLGYADASVFTDDPAVVAALLAAGRLGIDDLQGRGRHYAAVQASAPDVAGSSVTPSVFWLGNLGDGSGRVSVGATYRGLDVLTPSLAVTRTYGAAGAEYSPLGAGWRVELGLGVAGSF